MITNQELKSNFAKTGCTYRWNYSVIKLRQQKVRTCCQVFTNENITDELTISGDDSFFLNSKYLVDRKLEMLKGEKHPDCKPCWKLEGENFQSMRSHAESFENYFSPDFKKILKKPQISDDELTEMARFQKVSMLEIQLDNVCDLSCAYCNPEYSTTWAKKKGLPVERNESEQNIRFRKLFWQWYAKNHSNLKGVCIIGGEPLASPLLDEVFQNLIDINANNQALNMDQQFLSITSNFNAPPHLFQKFLQHLDVLKNYFNLSINASCEAFGERAEFIREGLVWQKFEHNVKEFLKFSKKNREQYHQLRIDFSFHAAQNAMSIEALPEFITFAKNLEREFDIPINLIQNIVSYPSYLSAQSILPKDFSVFCKEAIESISSHTPIRKQEYVDSSTWPLYEKFIDNIRAGLESRNQIPSEVNIFKQWYFSQLPDRQKNFQRLFPYLFANVIMKDLDV